MIITIAVDDASGALQVSLDREGVPVPLLCWHLEVARDVVKRAATSQEQPPLVRPVNGSALWKLPPMDGKS